MLVVLSRDEATAFSSGEADALVGRVRSEEEVMAGYGYERLSGLDTAFLLLESANVYTHVTSTLVFEGGPLRLADGGVDFGAIAKAHEALLHRIPRYRQVLRFAPVTGQPVWVDDTRFDLAYHLRHTSLPRPGSTEQLKRLSARVMQQHLDRSRPLWETWVVEGLEEGRFALIAKVHHCMIDGVAGIDLLQILLSADADASPDETPPVREPRLEPRPWQLLRDDLARRARLPFDLVRGLGGALRSADDGRRQLEVRASAALSTLDTTLRRPSATALNQPIGPHRRFEWRTLELTEVQEVRAALGGTVNDVVLAVASGAFARFLRLRGEDPAGLDFRALVPVSTRRPHERGALGNRISGWIVPMPLGETDPKQRMHQISARTAALKVSKQALGAELLTNAVEWTPATLLALGARAAARVLPFNTIVTNVPGPQRPMYLLGARLLEAYPHAPLVDRVGLGVALMSYAGRLHWGINGDYDAVPDLTRFAEALEESFEELRDASRAVSVQLEDRTGCRSAPATGRDESVRRAHRQGLTDRAREKHDALTAAIERLEHALAAPATGGRRWPERVAENLAFVREAIAAHVENVEEPGGLFEEILAEVPRLDGRVAALGREHSALAARGAALAERLTSGGEVDVGSLRDDVAELLRRLRTHRAVEADLVYEAFWTDLGAVD